MKHTKFILGDVQKIISQNLIKEETTKIINESLLYDIIFFVEEKSTFNKENIIYLDEFVKKFNLCKEVINRHIDWLIENGIIWRNHLEFNIETNMRNPYKYDINWNIKVTNYERFIYTTYKAFNELKENVPNVDNITKVNVLQGLNHTQIDYNSALNTIYNSEKMKRKGKNLQSLYVYQLAFKKFYITQKSIDKRIFHTITSISSELHKHLYIDGIKASSIDAKQSQLVLLSLLTKDVDLDYYNAVHNTYLYDVMIEFIKSKIEKESLIKNKDIKFQYFDGEENITKYISVNELDKKLIKPITYAALFSGFNNSQYNAVTEYFEIHFPKLVKYIRENYKKENSLSLVLQKMEASIWLSAFNKLSKSNIISVPKHDCLLFKYPNVNIILDELIYQYNLKGLNINKDNFTKYFDINLEKDNLYKQFELPSIVILDDFNDEYNNSNKLIQKLIGNTDLTVHTFFNKVTNEYFSGIKSVFLNKFGLDKSRVRELISGKIKSTKNWYYLFP
jgi:hypothetical protein